MANPVSAKITAYINSKPPWQRPLLRQIRTLIRKSGKGVVEAWKWNSPAFEAHGETLALLWGFKGWVDVMFTKGALLKDPKKVLNHGGTNKQMRGVKIYEGAKVPAGALKALLKQAVALNKAGVKLKRGKPMPKADADLNAVWTRRLEDAGLLKKFRARPPYQQRGYLRWVDQARREETKGKRVQTVLKELRQGTYMPAKKS